MTIVWLIIGAAIHIALCVHVVITGRSKVWFWIILLAPILGPFVYFFKEWVPDYLDTSPSSANSNKPFVPANPMREHTSAKENLDDFGTLETRLRFAASALGVGNYDEAISTYEQCIAAEGNSDPALRIKLVTAHYQSGNVIEAINQIDLLKKEHNGFNSEEIQLIYAQSLAKMGRYDDALECYEAFSATSAGEEARVCHAMLLQIMGRGQQACDLFNLVMGNVDSSPKPYQKAQAEWYRIAKLNR